MMGNGDASNSTNNKLKQRGALIVFEGGDRAGKSSQVERLAAHLTNSGVACRVLRFPGIFNGVLYHKDRALMAC